MNMDKYAKRELLRMRKARAVKDVGVTCPASRHAAMIGEALAKKRKYHMIDEEPEHVAATLLSTVASLWTARADLLRLKAKHGLRRSKAGW